MDKRADLAVAIAVIVIGLFYLYNAIQMPWTTTLNDVLGPRFVPQMLAILLIIFGAIVTVSRLRQWARSPRMVDAEGEEDIPGVPVSIPRVALMCGWFLLYIVSLVPIGYVITTPLFLAGSLLIMGVRSWRPIVGISLGPTILLFLLFAVGMRVQFPMGPLEAQWLEMSVQIDRMLKAVRL